MSDCVYYKILAFVVVTFLVLSSQVVVYGQNILANGNPDDPQSKHTLSWKRQPALVSPWSEELKSTTPLKEYPRPQMVRKEWMNLNGVWDFIGEGPTPPELPRKFSEKAFVPSATRAETSCLEKEWIAGWYRRKVNIPTAWKGKKVLLHFEAVGGISTVYFNSQELGKNTGSFKRFSFELTEFEAGKSNEILVHFDDREPRLSRGKPQQLAGIWQSVWLEPVSDDHIYSFRQTPDIDAEQLKIEINTNHASSDFSIVATAFESGKKVATGQGPYDGSLILNIEAPKLWSPENPFLYDLTLELIKGDVIIDRISSYFGMRKIETAEVDGVPRILLNNKIYYQVGLLDQGQWPESFFTPPSDEA